MQIYTLSKKEKNIMKVLWQSSNPLTASEICQLDNSLSINTVQASLKKLLRYEFIKIGDIVYSGTVLSRSYLPNITPDEYASFQLHEYYKYVNNNGSISNLVSCLLDKEEHEEETLNELQKMIDERKGKHK